MSSNTSEDELNMSGGLKNLMNAKTKSATKAQTSKAANQRLSSKKSEDDEEEEEYDLAEYGDEFNDEMERKYAQEHYGLGKKSKKPASGDKEDKEEESEEEDDEEEGEEEGESEESEPPVVESLAKNFSRRSNRGQKMNALVTKAREADDDQDDFWGVLGADYFGIPQKKKKRKGGPQQFNQAGGGLSENEADDEDELMNGLLADDDQDFDSAEASEDDAQDSFDSDFGREEEEDEDENDEQGQPGKRQKTGQAGDEADEDKIIELQEKKEATKKKVKFHQSLIQKSTKKKDQAPSKKRIEKQNEKEEGKIEDNQEEEAAKIQAMSLRKSSRISKIIGQAKVEKKPGEDSNTEGKPKSSPNEKKGPSQPAQGQNQKGQNRAPVGSLTNNPEWNGVISELDKAWKSGIINEEQYDKWFQLLKQDNLTPLEKMQEAAFTELINVRSLEQQKIEEDERMKEMLGKRDQWKPDEKVFKYRQSIHNTEFLSEYVFPSISHYPKSFNTRDMRTDPNFMQNDNGAANTQFIKPAQHILKQNSNANDNVIPLNPSTQPPVNLFLEPKHFICPITGLRAPYRDPLTGTPFANKEAFKIIREKFFQRDEEKLFVRMQVLNDLLMKKRKKLRKKQQAMEENNNQQQNVKVEDQAEQPIQAIEEPEKQ